MVSHPSRSRSFTADLVRLAAIVGLFYFALLGLRPLGNPDEGRYTEIPREMAVSGDFVTPRLNGVKYFEKPPLLYWLTAATVKVGGVNEVTARFWPAFFGVLGVLIAYAAACALFDRLTGLFSAGVLATSLLYYGLNRIALLDGAVTVLIAAALFSFLVGIRTPSGTRRRVLFSLFYGAMALAVLAKGLIGLALPCAVVGLWVLVLNRWKELRPFYPFSGTLIVLAIAGPWHVLAARANPEFLQFYFVHEHFERFTSRVHDRYAPFWYFVPVLLGGLFPWVVFFFQGVRQALAGGWSSRSRNEVAWFLFLWIAFIFFFFSKSQSKLAPYILPVFPAAAVLIGRVLAQAWEEPERFPLRLPLWIYSALAVAMGAALPFVKIVRDVTLRAELRPWQWTLATAFLLSGALVGWWATQRRTRTALCALMGGTVLTWVLLNPAAAHADKRSTKPLVLALKSQLRPDDAVYLYKYYIQDVPVYLEREVNVVDFEGELEFGVKAEPARTADRFIGTEEFVRRWTGPARAFAVARKGDAAALLARSDFPHVVLAEAGDQILISNRRP